jgi:hypothetical protein
MTSCSSFGIGFHHIHCFWKHFNPKLFKISLKNRHKKSQNTLKSPKANIYIADIKPPIIGLNKH